jgi:hypothetical protein
MNVKKAIKISDLHSIEWGESTWDDNDFSIRNRKNREDGGFNQSASSEIPWYNFNEMILLSIENNQFSKGELNAIVKKIIDTHLI